LGAFSPGPWMPALNGQAIGKGWLSLGKGVRGKASLFPSGVCPLSALGDRWGGTDYCGDPVQWRRRRRSWALGRWGWCFSAAERAPSGLLHSDGSWHRCCKRRGGGPEEGGVWEIADRGVRHVLLCEEHRSHREATDCKVPQPYYHQPLSRWPLSARIRSSMGLLDGRFDSSGTAAEHVVEDVAAMDPTVVSDLCFSTHPCRMPAKDGEGRQGNRSSRPPEPDDVRRAGQAESDGPDRQACACAMLVSVRESRRKGDPVCGGSGGVRLAG
jgi:hypothetical protein